MLASFLLLINEISNHYHMHTNTLSFKECGKFETFPLFLSPLSRENLTRYWKSHSLCFILSSPSFCIFRGYIYILIYMCVCLRLRIQ